MAEPRATIDACRVEISGADPTLTYYIEISAEGVDTARSYVFSPSADGEHVFSSYIFPKAGTYTVQLKLASDGSDADDPLSIDVV